MAEKMTIVDLVYRLDSHGFYPRPHHFYKRLVSLTERFKNVTGAFGEPFHDRKRLQKIDDTFHQVTSPIAILVSGNEPFKLDRFVITKADKWATVPDPITVMTSEHKGLRIALGYIKIEGSFPQAQATINRVIEHISGCLKQLDKEETLFETLFVFCEMPPSYEHLETEMPTIRQYISDSLAKQSDQWPGTSRIIMGPDHVTLGSLVSDYLEEKLLDVFRLIYDYLSDVFIYSGQCVPAKGDLVHEAGVERALYNYVRDLVGLSELVEQHRLQQQDMASQVDNRTETEIFLDIVIDDMAKKLKCLIVEPLASKLGLKRVICSVCLDEIRFDKRVRRHISASSKRNLKNIYPSCEKYEEIMKQVNARKIGDKEKLKHYKKNDFAVHGLQNDLSIALIEVEKELGKAVGVIDIMGKMRFEIEGYFKLAGIPIGKPPKKIPRELFDDLLRIEQVVGTGTIYGKLEVHIKEKPDIIEVKKQLEEVKLDVAQVIKKHMYTQPYVVRAIKREAQPLARIQHEHGNPIKSPFPGQEQRLREGTLGSFVEDTIEQQQGQSKKLYALTCAHVVNPYNMPGSPVYVIGNGARLTRLGVSTPQLTVSFGMDPDATLIDIAAVEVDAELSRDCLRHVKNEDGWHRPSYISDSDYQELEKLVVYKFGAKTGFSQGIVCSSEYMTTLNATNGTDYLLVIDKLQTSMKEFAKQGDSGSIVCMPSIAKDKPDNSVAIVAMVNAGELQLEGLNSDLCLSFLFKRGLQTLARKSGLQLKIP